MSSDTVNTFLSSGDKYRKEWQNLLSFLDHNNIEKLKFLSFNGEIKVSKFRSICWAILLRVLNSNPKDWSDQRLKQRQKYGKLKNEFSINPHKESFLNDDPLSQSEKSVWNQYFDDQNLLTAIKQDVIRTFPGVEFFRKLIIQESMTNILFLYAREHPYMCYRQGMHEILAPILFVIYYDQQSLLHFIDLDENIDSLLLDVLNPDHFEADAYFLFSRVMSSIESYYKITNFKPTADGYFPIETEINDEEFSNTTEVVIIGQLNLIRDNILAKEDEHLHNHLLKLDIQMHIFGIRWLRVLFGREFPFLDLLMLWDAIFADSDRFELPNYIVVAMLIRIRDKLLLNDYTTCLMHLMKYPSNADIGLILRHALHLQMPKRFERPANAFIYVTMKPNVMKTNNKPINQSTLKLRKLKLEYSASLENYEFPKALSKPRSRTSSLNSSSIIQQTNDKQSELLEIQYRNAMNAARLENIKAAPENVIFDGYSEDSPEYLKLQLQNAQTIINVSQMKLQKYLTTFRKYITRKNAEDLNQAVDGIEELCAFLDVKFQVPSSEIHQQKVDVASEAISDILSPNAEKKSKLLSTLQKKIPNKNHKKTDAEVKTEFVKILESKKNSFEIEVDEYGNSMEFKKGNNSNAISSSSNPQNKPTGTRYEIPDIGFMKNSSKVLGTRMNVELRLFKEEHGENNENDGIPIADPLRERD